MHSLPDPLGVRAAARFVMERARHVSINATAIERVSDQIMTAPPGEAHWTTEHLGAIQLDDTSLANYTLVLDALNFCFWGSPRWRVTYLQETSNGYRALAAALRRALDEGYPITDAAYLAQIPTLDVAMILRGESVTPLFATRVANLRETGQGLIRDYDGSFAQCIRQADGSAVSLLRRIITSFPSFVDVSVYQSRTIPFYKRAQILVSDVSAAFPGSGLGRFHDLEALTAFADYKVPQVLHQLGVLRYPNRLIERLRRHEHIPRGSEEEIEIRSATICAVEEIGDQLAARGYALPDYQIDWLLWNLGQDMAGDELPYHRTVTTAY
jgi:hypothetical protein